MGCDIHLYSETRKNGKWVADRADTYSNQEEEGEEPYMDMNSSFGMSRHYGLFGLLSKGVRWNCPWAFEQRGIPEDASPEVATLHRQWVEDAHSASHLTRVELKEKAMSLMVEAHEDATTLSGLVMQLIADLPATDNPDEQRVVFWFDN